VWLRVTVTLSAGGKSTADPTPGGRAHLDRAAVILDDPLAAGRLYWSSVNVTKRAVFSRQIVAKSGA